MELNIVVVISQGFSMQKLEKAKEKYEFRKGDTTPRKVEEIQSVTISIPRLKFFTNVKLEEKKEK